ncbi:hypothetical protein C8F01DRAFT_1143949 [Mycena amicta]|nr:hypothetical protein C8F01DRAFT_1143949 [Mycena amicta]
MPLAPTRCFSAPSPTLPYSSRLFSNARRYANASRPLQVPSSCSCKQDEQITTRSQTGGTRPGAHHLFLRRCGLPSDVRYPSTVSPLCHLPSVLTRVQNPDASSCLIPFPHHRRRPTLPHCIPSQPTKRQRMAVTVQLLDSRPVHLTDAVPDGIRGRHSG